MDLVKILTDNQHYLVLMASIAIIGKIFLLQGISQSIASSLLSKVKNERLAFGSLYALSGILPIPGRVIMTAPILSGMTSSENPDSKKRLGIANYVMAHHYYLWSPLEESVIIVLGGTGLSYFAFLGMTWPFVLTYFAFMFYMVAKFMKKEDFEFDKNAGDNSRSGIKLALISLPFIAGILQFLYFGGDVFSGSEKVGISIMAAITLSYCFLFKVSVKETLSFVNWKSMFFLFSVIVLGNIVKAEFGTFKELLSSLGSAGIAGIAVLGGVFSFLMGSSSKYAGLAVVSSKTFGLQYLPVFFIADFIGYLMSPTHKCLVMSSTYFGNSIRETLPTLLKLSTALSSVLILKLVFF